MNNLVSELLEVASISKSSLAVNFSRSGDGWIFVTAACKGKGAVTITLDPGSKPDAMVVRDADSKSPSEAMRFVRKGEHTLQIECQGKARVEKLIVKAIPELIHCGLGFDPAIKSYGHYDMDFLSKDILPNVTTLVVPSNIKLPEPVIADWHRQGKKFIAEAGVNSSAKTAEEHAKYWTGFYERAPFIDGIIINEFIINNPSARPGMTNSPERQRRMEQEQERHQMFGDAIKEVRADSRCRDKTLYAYFGGSGKKLNQEMIGTNFIRTIVDSGSRIALERYLHEMSSEKGSKEALQTFVDGIEDWNIKEPAVNKHMVIAFGLFSMPPGGLNKLPNVDYHVWMDQQMNVVANNPVMAGLAGLEWWTTSQTDEDTVRFVGKLYRHYAIDGKKELFTKDPLFLNHIEDADFEKGTEGWALHSAEHGTTEVRKFARYGRIEGRFMGLGRPADPEHIGDSFLWMKRSEKGPNSFSQSIRNLQPGRLYSMKMFTCDYNDLINPKQKKIDEANKFLGSVVLEGVTLDAKKSFTEMYASNPEPKIPVWITYHWKVFRAKGPTARLTVSDWPAESAVGFGQEQTFNFIEIQPYWE